MASIAIRFAIAGSALAVICMAGCGGRSQQQIAEERAQVEVDMATSARIERERDAQVKRDAAVIVAAHDAAERDENAKAQAAAAEQEKSQEAMADK
jgi:predicted  nucleic acid-binding Zn-ribbon protein